MSKLTDRDVLEIRAKYRRARPGTTYLSLANEYDVGHGTIWAVLTGVTWRHLLPKGAVMPELDKWQKRQAQELADTEGITYEEAVAKLFPGDVVAEVAEAEAEAEQVTEGVSTPAPKASSSKAGAK